MPTALLVQRSLVFTLAVFLAFTPLLSSVGAVTRPATVAGQTTSPHTQRFALAPRPPTRSVNYLIAGVAPDYRAPGVRAPENFRGNTDSLLLVQLDPVSNTVRTLSLPRDTRVWLPGHGWRKLNSALPRLGPNGMVRAVETLTGLRIQAYVLVNLNGVRHLTEALGGVDIYVPQDMTYDDKAAGLHIRLKRAGGTCPGRRPSSSCGSGKTPWGISDVCSANKPS